MNPDDERPDSFYPCDTCGSMASIDELIEYNVPNGPDDFDVQYVCPLCVDRWERQVERGESRAGS